MQMERCWAGRGPEGMENHGPALLHQSLALLLRVNGTVSLLGETNLPLLCKPTNHYVQ